MKFKLLFIIGLTCLVAICSARPAEEEYGEYEDEPAPPPPKPTRPNPLKNRRNPLAGRTNGKATSTTTQAPAKVEESEIEEEPLDEEQEQVAAPTTEAPKKFKAGSVRPFRSNDELLAALKRRREQASHHKPAPKAVEKEEESGVEATPAAPSKNRVNNGRKRFNLNKAEPQNHPEENAATPTPVRAGRRFSARN